MSNGPGATETDWASVLGPDAENKFFDEILDNFCIFFRQKSPVPGPRIVKLYCDLKTILEEGSL